MDQSSIVLRDTFHVSRVTVFKWWEKAKWALHRVKCPLSVWIGSPGRTRTCDQPVTSAPVFQPGLDYLFTRLQKKQGRVSGASEAVLDGFRSL